MSSRRLVRALLIDDDPDTLEAVTVGLISREREVETARCGSAGLNALRAGSFDAVLIGLDMAGSDGLTIVREARLRTPQSAVIVMTRRSSIDTAVEAIKLGADQFVIKPVDVDALDVLVRKAGERRRQALEAESLRDELAHHRAFRTIVGTHPTIVRLLRTVARVAATSANVLVTGETGTGKELVAAALHEGSPRSHAPFVCVNCAALPPPLLESELFGHERGAFTGAIRRREGRFQRADHGTVFLDEVSEIPLPLQVKLLRVLQERAFEPVGSDDTVHVDVRVVAATNRPLPPLVKDGTFREDLYYRLNVVELELPPLRARPSDIPLLVEHFLEKSAARNDRGQVRLSQAATELLIAYPWPGNVRELEHAIERAVVMTDGPVIDIEAFEILHPLVRTDSLTGLIPGLTLAQLEELAVRRTLDAVGGSTAQAAKILGISQRKIQYRLKDWGR